MSLTASTRTLKALAALVWLVGGIMHLLKGGSLLAEAGALRPGLPWPWVAVAAALLLGGLKARFLFSQSCRRNLARIAALDPPRIWRFFKPGFLVALAVMILTGTALSRFAHNQYFFLLGVAVLDLGIAVALLGSSHVFWREKSLICE
jgi:hypothetical protein